MPYIKQKFKDKIDESIHALVDDIEQCCKDDDRDALKGVLNYTITSILLATFTKHGISYSKFADVIGTLECSKLEIYRRAIASYEDRCIRNNGDIEEFIRMGL
jgi:hypothetical protein